MARRTSSSIAGLVALVGLGCASGREVPPEDVTRWVHSCERASRDGSFVLTPSSRLALAAIPKPREPVLIYGASWCAVCDIAASYLKQRGIPFAERDVERDDGAEAAMRDTLVHSGLPVERALPVIDVRGNVMVGFNPCVLEAIWQKP